MFTFVLVATLSAINTLIAIASEPTRPKAGMITPRKQEKIPSHWPELFRVLAPLWPRRSSQWTWSSGTKTWLLKNPPPPPATLLNRRSDASHHLCSFSDDLSFLLTFSFWLAQRRNSTNTLASLSTPACDFLVAHSSHPVIEIGKALPHSLQIVTAFTAN
jgi:hypothetical protein